MNCLIVLLVLRLLMIICFLPLWSAPAPSLWPASPCNLPSSQHCHLPSGLLCSAISTPISPAPSPASSSPVSTFPSPLVCSALLSPLQSVPLLPQPLPLQSAQPPHLWSTPHSAPFPPVSPSQSSLLPFVFLPSPLSVSPAPYLSDLSINHFL